MLVLGARLLIVGVRVVGLFFFRQASDRYSRRKQDDAGFGGCVLQDVVLNVPTAVVRLHFEELIAARFVPAPKMLLTGVPQCSAQMELRIVNSAVTCCLAESRLC